MHTFTKGQKVNVINATLNGHFFLEGKARIVRRIEEIDEQYIVDFGSIGGTVERFVDPQAQGDDVNEYVNKLNAIAKGQE